VSRGERLVGGLLGLLVVSAAASLAGRAASPAKRADVWPKFRGTDSGVAADDPRLPDTWSSRENVAWKTRIPGYAWSSPIVWGRYVFVTSVISREVGPTPGLVEVQEGRTHLYHGPAATSVLPTDEHRWVLVALDFANGKILWQCELFKGLPRDAKHPQNSYASETPVTDGKRVYVYSGTAGLFAVDFTGKLAWSRRVVLPDVRGTTTAVSADISKASGREADEKRNLQEGELAGLGSGASPVLFNDRLFIAADHEPRQWFAAAYDTKTGKELWRAEHVKKVQAYGWSSPFIWENSRRVELITAGDLGVRAFDLDGHPLWQLSGLSFNTVPTPLAVGDLLYVASGHPGDLRRPIVAIRPGGSGDISLKSGETSSEYVAWIQPQASSHLPSPLVYGDYLYTLHTQGFLTCHRASTGEQVYGRKRISIDSSFFTASPWAYNGRIFAMSEDGDTYVIQAGPDYKVLAKNSLEEMTYATPAIAGGSLIIRTKSAVYRITKGRPR
jgi:hypothetical protein